MRFSTIQLAATCVVALGLSSTHAATKYWDINSTDPGAGNVGGFTDGDWDLAAANWNTNSAGTDATTTWVAGDDAVFSAGTDAVDAAVTVFAGVNPTSLTIEEGIVRFSGTAINMGANPVRVNQGATLQIPSASFITPAAGHVLTLDGGTVLDVNVGAGIGNYPSTNTAIQLTANGGTFDIPTNASNAYNIQLYNGNVGLASGTTTATLTKKGPGEFRGLNNWTFTALNVEQGLYRINGTGGGETGFGAATGTITTSGGAMANTTQGSALGTSIGITSPATRSIVLGGTGNTAFVLNAGWAIDSIISGPGGLMLNGWTRTDTNALIGSQGQLLTLRGANTYNGETLINFGTLVAVNGSAIPDNSAVKFSTNNVFGITTVTTAALRVDNNETIGSLAGGLSSLGSVNINGATVTLTTGNDNTTTTLDGAITGTGALKKVGSGTFNMNGAKSYTGDTTVAGGTLSTNSASLADLADVYLATGSLLNLNFTGTDTIDSLFINGVSQAVGTWGGTGSGATNISALLSGTGVLQVTTLVSVGVPGDYNNNGTVDAADYVLWRKGGPLQNEVDTPGTVNAADYTEWRARFGNTAGSGSALGAGAVPEPSMLVLILVGLSGLGVVRRAR